jgi:hypothetical protein
MSLLLNNKTDKIMWRKVSVVFILFLRLLSTILTIQHSVHDDISIIRQRVLQSMVWPANETIPTVMRNALLFARTLNNSCYWSDIDYSDKSVVVWKTEEHMLRITTMIQALCIERLQCEVEHYLNINLFALSNIAVSNHSTFSLRIFPLLFGIYFR